MRRKGNIMSVYTGIDVSKWQGEINWSLVKNAGIQFAMIRSSFGWGAGQKDKFFELNYKNAKNTGIYVGAYHYAYATSTEEAIKEADHCHSILKDKKFEYPIAYDMEENRISSLGKEKVSEIAKAFCERMESYGYYVCIYANKYWLDNYFTDEIFEKYDIWLAQWAEKPTFTRAYGMWQKTSKGRVNGIDTNVDLDESYKNYASIMRYNGLNGFGKEAPVEPAKKGYNAGHKVVLKNAKLYTSAYSKMVASHISGTYYIYDGIYFNGRYRVTNSLKNVERKPIGKYVTGYVDRDDLR